MHRREYLISAATVGGFLSLSGCLSPGEEGDGNGGEDDGGDGGDEGEDDGMYSLSGPVVTQ